VIAPLNYPSFDQARYFPALDGLRALAVTLVMCNHLSAPVPAWLHGYLGVEIFFVLSGFLITTLLLRERLDHGRVSLAGFYLRRFFRIVPVYFLTIALYYVAVRVLDDDLKAAQFDVALPWLLTFMREYAPAAAGNVMGHAWTLGVEEKFYLLWPLLLIALYPFQRRGLVLLALISVAALVLVGPLARAYAGLLTGVLLALGIGAATRPGRLPAVPQFVLLMFAALAYLLVGVDPAFDPLFGAAMALLMGSLLLRTSLLRQLLEHPWLVFVGRRSYSMYLIHVLAANAVSQLAPPALNSHWLVALAGTFAISLAGASVLYVVVEKPCIRFGRTLAARAAQAPRAASAESAAPLRD